MQDLNDKVTGNSLTAAEWNEVPSEIQNIIEGLGITLSGADLNQLGKGIAGYVANGNFYTDSGAADAYVLTQIGSKQALPEYTDGMLVEFIAGNTSTGASTVNVAGLGVKNIADTGVAGAIAAVSRYQLRYRSSSGDFEIIKSTVSDGSMFGLTIGIDPVDTQHDVLIAVGSAMDSGNAVLLELLSELTKRIDAAWVAGDDAGGLFSGSVANNTWYHLFLIRKDSDGSIDAGFDTSVSAANIPAGYTAYKWIGAVLTDGSANILPFINDPAQPDKFSWFTFISDYASTPDNTSRDIIVLSTPLGIKVNALIDISFVSDGGNDTCLISDLNAIDVAANANAATVFSSSSTRGGAQAQVTTNTLREVGIRNNAAGLTTNVNSHGWVVARSTV